MFAKKSASSKKPVAKHSGSLKNHRPAKDKKYDDKAHKKQKLVFNEDAWEKAPRRKTNERKIKELSPKKHNVLDDFSGKTYATHKKNYFSGCLKTPFGEENAHKNTLENKKKSSTNKAKKMTLRRPNKEILQKSEKLREIRSEIEKPESLILCLKFTFRHIILTFTITLLNFRRKGMTFCNYNAYFSDVFIYFFPKSNNL